MGIDSYKKCLSKCQIGKLNTWFIRMPPTPELEVQEIWVNVTEAAEATGYNREYIKKFIMKIWKLPEDQRSIQVRKRSSGFDIWLPDLVAYLHENGRGPKGKRKITP